MPAMSALVNVRPRKLLDLIELSQERHLKPLRFSLKLSYSGYLKAKTPVFLRGFLMELNFKLRKLRNLLFQKVAHVADTQERELTVYSRVVRTVSRVASVVCCTVHVRQVVAEWICWIFSVLNTC